MFNTAERNYDIYERELLAVIKSLEHWRPHLAATSQLVKVLTDHANLTFWKLPRKVNRRVARWFTTLQDYNLEIQHIPEKLHVVPDMLSRPSIHLPLRQSAMQKAPHTTKRVHSLPPPNGWTVQEKKPMGGAIPETSSGGMTG